MAVVVAIAAAAAERGATGVGEARGGTFHMNQSSGGSGSTDGEGFSESRHVRYE